MVPLASSTRKSAIGGASRDLGREGASFATAGGSCAPVSQVVGHRTTCAKRRKPSTTPYKLGATTSMMEFARKSWALSGASHPEARSSPTGWWHPACKGLGGDSGGIPASAREAALDAPPPGPFLWPAALTGSRFAL